MAANKPIPNGLSDDLTIFGRHDFTPFETITCKAPEWVIQRVGALADLIVLSGERRRELESVVARTIRSITTGESLGDFHCVRPGYVLLLTADHDALQRSTGFVIAEAGPAAGKLKVGLLDSPFDPTIHLDHFESVVGAFKEQFGSEAVAVVISEVAGKTRKNSGRWLAAWRAFKAAAGSLDVATFLVADIKDGRARELIHRLKDPDLAEVASIVLTITTFENDASSRERLLVFAKSTSDHCGGGLYFEIHEVERPLHSVPSLRNVVSCDNDLSATELVRTFEQRVSDKYKQGIKFWRDLTQNGAPVGTDAAKDAAEEADLCWHSVRKLLRSAGVEVNYISGRPHYVRAPDASGIERPLDRVKRQKGSGPSKSPSGVAGFFRSRGNIFAENPGGTLGSQDGSAGLTPWRPHGESTGGDFLNHSDNAGETGHLHQAPQVHQVRQTRPRNRFHQHAQIDSSHTHQIDHLGLVNQAAQDGEDRQGGQGGQGGQADHAAGARQVDEVGLAGTAVQTEDYVQTQEDDQDFQDDEPPVEPPEQEDADGAPESPPMTEEEYLAELLQDCASELSFKWGSPLEGTSSIEVMQRFAKDVLVEKAPHLAGNIEIIAWLVSTIR